MTPCDTASNAVPMPRLPTISGVKQAFQINATNDGPSTYAQMVSPLRPSLAPVASSCRLTSSSKAAALRPSYRLSIHF